MSNQSKIKIRFCRMKELSRVAALVNRSYSVPYKPGKLIIKAKETLKKMQEKIKFGSKILIAEKGNRIVGTVRYHPVGKKELELNRLAVLPRYRCEGIGSLLIKKVAGIAKRNGYKILSLDVAEEKGLVPFYEKLAFTVKSKIKHHNHHDVFMVRKI